MNHKKFSEIFRIKSTGHDTVLFLCISLLLIITAVIIYFGCNGPMQQFPPPPSGNSPCTGITPPQLLDVLLAGKDGVPQDTITIAEGDPLNVYVGYNDEPECILSGGGAYYSLDGGNNVLGLTLGDVPCSSDATAGAIKFDVSVTGQTQHTITVFLKDSCNLESGSHQNIFNVSGPATEDDDSGTDDDSGSDDDTSVGTKLAGTITYTGSSSGSTIYIYIFDKWFPTEAPLVTGEVTVPGSGFPFSYEIDLGSLAAGNYYVFAYMDTDTSDGDFNITKDPFSTPSLPVHIVVGQTTTYNFTLKDLTKTSGYSQDYQADLIKSFNAFSFPKHTPSLPKQ